MRNFSLRISPKRKWDFGSLAELERVHQSVKLTEFKSDEEAIPIVVCGLQNIGRNLKRFELNDCDMCTKSFLSVIASMAFLNDVRVVGVKLSDDGELVDENLPQLNHLTNLNVVESDAAVFRIFLKARNLQKICFNADGHCETRDLSSLESCLVFQPKLNTLELVNIKFSNFLAQFIDFPFQLKSLTVTNCHFTVKGNLERFLEQQKRLENVDMTFGNMKMALDRLRYFDASLATIVRQRNLKTFKLEIDDYDFINCNFLHRFVNPRVECLSLSLEKTSVPLAMILGTFSHVTTLSLSVKELSQESISYMNENLRKLNELTVTRIPSESFAGLKISSLKSLHVNEANIETSHWIEFLENNSQITKLAINFTFFMDLSEDFIDVVTKKLNLEHLELLDKFIGFRNEIYETICGNSKNLKYLKLHNINVEKDFDDIDKEYLRSRNIRFHLFNDESLNTPIIPF